MIEHVLYTTNYHFPIVELHYELHTRPNKRKLSNKSVLGNGIEISTLNRINIFPLSSMRYIQKTSQFMELSL